LEKGTDLPVFHGVDTGKTPVYKEWSKERRVGGGGYKGFPTFGVIHPSTSTRPLHLLPYPHYNQSPKGKSKKYFKTTI